MQAGVGGLCTPGGHRVMSCGGLQPGLEVLRTSGAQGLSSWWLHRRVLCTLSLPILHPQRLPFAEQGSSPTAVLSVL